MNDKPTSKIATDIRGRILANLPVLFLYSLAINILIMAGPLFMLQVYDRVLPSKSIPTLGGLFVLILVLFMFLALFEYIRSRIVTRIALYVDRRANSAGVSGNLLIGIGANKGQLLAAEPASRIRDFLRSGGVESFLDLAFVPIYLICLSALHPLLSIVTLLGAFTVGALTIFSNFLSKPLLAQSGRMTGAEKSLEGQYASHAREILTMGMAPVLMKGLQEAHNKSLTITHKILSGTQFFRSLSKGVRPLVQASTLGTGAYLVINGELSAGTMIASSIMAGRLLQPIDQSINHWPAFVAARQAFASLKQIVDHEDEEQPASLPKPAGKLELSKVTVLNKEKMAQGLALPLLHDINFALNAGDGLCITGPSGAGKSVLIDVLIGANTADRGEIRLDGSRYQQWNKDELGQHLGFLPQCARLMPGTILQNISRFATTDRSEEAISAAHMCGIHERILALPDGYNTMVDDRKVDQPAGFVQLICLARAVFGNPSLVILDEPTANLDHEGEQSLVRCIHQLRLNGSTVLAATHRGFVARPLNKVLVLNNGKQVSFDDNTSHAERNGQTAAARIAA